MLHLEQLIIIAKIGYAHPGVLQDKTWDDTALSLLISKGVVIKSNLPNRPSAYRLSPVGTKRLDILKSIIEL